MAGSLAPFLKQTWTDANGNPLSGGKLYSYQAGTTTPQATYTDSSLVTPNANPVILNTAGQADMWLNPSLSYKFILKDSADVQQWSVDNVIGLLTVDAVNTASIQNLAVTTAKLALNSVDSTILKSDASVDGNRAVQTNHIRDGAVTSVKMNATQPTVQKFTSGSGTYTKPAGCLRVRVRMVGGGGGGGGALVFGGTGEGPGGDGTASTFGSSLLSAGGGLGGPSAAQGATTGALGGTSSLGSGPVGIALTGGSGGSSACTSSSSLSSSGGIGGSSAFGGAGFGGNGVAGGNGVTNSGGGGGGGGAAPNASASVAGAGGGSGGFVDAIITGPSATYAYSVGTGGSAGAAGTSGFTGGVGAAGIILVEEFY